MLKTYKILSLLLDYPDEALVRAIPFFREEIEKENKVHATCLKNLETFLSVCSSMSLSDWQMMYVGQFDCSQAVNLYLFDHIYGDSKARGQAMVDLKEMYNRSGFRMISNELPDFLPLFLEYLSFQDSPEVAGTLLFEVKPVLEKIGKKLEENDHLYRHLFRILVELAAKEKEWEEKCM